MEFPSFLTVHRQNHEASMPFCGTNHLYGVGGQCGYLCIISTCLNKLIALRPMGMCMRINKHKTDFSQQSMYRSLPSF